MLCFIGAPSSPVLDIISSQKENECAVFVRPLEPLSSDCPVVLFYTISYRRQGDNEWTRLNITESTTKSQIKIETEYSTEYEFQLVAWSCVGVVGIVVKWDQAPLLIRRTQRKGMKWHQAPLLIRRTQRKEMQQRIMKEVYMCCSKFLFQLILMSPLFEINYHHYHTQKQ